MNISPRCFYTLPLHNAANAYAQFLRWAQQYATHIAFLNSNKHALDPYGKHNAMLAVGAHKECTPQQQSFEELKRFAGEHRDWMLGFFSYDLKNQLENLHSHHPDGIKMPLMHFFVPEILFLFFDDHVQIGLLPNSPHQPEVLLQEVLNSPTVAPVNMLPMKVRHRVSRKQYIETVNRIQNHIRAGDIYEMNYCIEFFCEEAELEPVETFIGMNARNPSPFSCFLRFEDKYLISSSPERFLAKRGQKLISQPIKGTIRRGCNVREDEILKLQLLNDPKERSENVMIVDLVRNDLSRTAARGSVQVEELFGIYTYPRVHQMISTVTAQLHRDVHYLDAIREAFPMGSMTGAPKVRAMQIIEECEATRRGLYSGAVGYLEPGHDFDFNVIIRSILYNRSEKFLSFMAGSAITIDADPEKEYHECLLKAGSMAQAVNAQL